MPLLREKKMGAIARDGWEGDGWQVAEAIKDRVSGGIADCAGMDQPFRYLAYRPISGPDAYYAIGRNMFFDPGWEDMPPDGRLYPDHFMKWFDRNPNKFKQWRRLIDETAGRHECGCANPGDSWHDNLQNCACESVSLEGAAEKMGGLLSDVRGMRRRGPR